MKTTLSHDRLAFLCAHICFILPECALSLSSVPKRLWSSYVSFWPTLQSTTFHLKLFLSVMIAVILRQSRSSLSAKIHLIVRVLTLLRFTKRNHFRLVSLDGSLFLTCPYNTCLFFSSQSVCLHVPMVQLRIHWYYLKCQLYCRCALFKCLNILTSELAAFT